MLGGNIICKVSVVVILWVVVACCYRCSNKRFLTGCVSFILGVKEKVIFFFTQIAPWFNIAIVILKTIEETAAYPSLERGTF